MAESPTPPCAPPIIGLQRFISPIGDILQDVRDGRMVIMADSADRENEGDLVISASAANRDVINFMAKFGRGLICLPLSPMRAARFGLRPMTSTNTDPFSTAFTQSVDARDGISTGISASDRAATVAVLASSHCTAADLVSPGHLFPLIARAGGVLERAGHTEAAVDLSSLAGRVDAGVICEIMRDDGEMARLPDLVTFGREHGLRIGTIADLLEFRLRGELEPAISDHFIFARSRINGGHAA
ncbi:MULTISPECIES: 3,4-dihydroxy-2-butanone-4-phosphate synthase [unclassified Chelatococcus]|uniref:3,4-dihydroxy-2-butanone-4-phosphate synthase n=1 Tax=unclassified Chelatococcus TaxID=2638111 RepID=UPI001BD00F28|nr:MULTISPECIES: 3,4-dihydroxy-2-butanone-4-phosphate synthase [unclassified Chelatococcus]MBS7698551.1 3,4-dihydroxy-2-butanone-4-phosphate synthase [Chelatococcus sp. YT9]MBX3554798.1 3,4-dihydroxy-2-butanone-4-phosphate synthase [Chelatococcus sp.]